MLQAVVYFLDARRIAEPSYFTRFLAILRHPIGRPLLDCVAASAPQLAALLQQGPLPPGLEARAGVMAHSSAVALISGTEETLSEGNALGTTVSVRRRF